MSVALYIKNKNNDSEYLIPVATEKSFKILEDISVSLSLVWIPLFRTGLPIEAEDIPPITKEITMLISYLKERAKSGQNSVNNKALMEDFISRLDGLKNELERIQGEDFEMYIG